MCNCIAQGQMRVCTVTQKVTFLVPCFLPAMGAAGARQASGVLTCPPDSPAAVRRALGSEPRWPLVSVSFSLPPLAHKGAADWEMVSER